MVQPCLFQSNFHLYSPWTSHWPFPCLDEKFPLFLMGYNHLTKHIKFSQWESQRQKIKVLKASENNGSQNNFWEVVIAQWLFSLQGLWSVCSPPASLHEPRWASWVPTVHRRKQNKYLVQAITPSTGKHIDFLGLGSLFKACALLKIDPAFCLGSGTCAGFTNTGNHLLIPIIGFPNMLPDT